MLFRCPLLELPSSTIYPKTISSGLESSKQIFSAIDIDHSPYLSTRSHILDPSIPSCVATPLSPMSYTWSKAAYERPLEYFKGVFGVYFFKYSMASLTASAPSEVIILTLVPGIL